MKAKAFLITKKEFIKEGKLLNNEDADKNSFLSFGLKKDVKNRFIKKMKEKSWEDLKNKNWTIKKVTVEIK